MLLHRILDHWAQQRGKKLLSTAPECFLGLTFSSCLIPKLHQMDQNGPQSLLPVHLGHILCHCTILAIIGAQIKGPIATQKGSITFRISLPIVCVQNGLKRPPKSTTSILGFNPLSMHKIWDHLGFFGCIEFEILECFYIINQSKWSENTKS